MEGNSGQGRGAMKLDLTTEWQDYRATITIEAQFAATSKADAKRFLQELQAGLLSGTAIDEEHSHRGCDVADVCEITKVKFKRMKNDGRI